MKPFRFSLQSLHLVRQHKEEATRGSYAKTLRACEAAAANMENASAELTQCWTNLCQQLAGGLTGAELLRTRAWCNVLELRVKERAAVLEDARHAVDAVWQELMLATQARETLDRLEAKRRNGYDQDFRREEQKHMDDLALQLVRAPLNRRWSNQANRISV